MLEQFEKVQIFKQEFKIATSVIMNFFLCVVRRCGNELQPGIVERMRGQQNVVLANHTCTVGDGRVIFPLYIMKNIPHLQVQR